jgi:hypothetical protein
MLINYKINRNKKIVKSKFIVSSIIKNINEKETIDLQKLIDLFNSEYKWEGMFTIEQAIERIKNGQNLFILYYKNCAIGYVWFKEIDKQKCFGYNLYVTKKEKRPGISPYWFYKYVTDYMLVNYDTIEVEVEDWNLAIKDIIEMIGYYE